MPSVSKDERLLDLLSVWQAERENGRSLSPEELCPEDGPLRESLREHIAAALRLSAKSNPHDTTAERDMATGARTAIIGFGPPAAAGEVGTLGPYRILKELGKGGMGAVYAAVDTRLDRRLALKVMLPECATDREARERFLREARAAARVKHDHVVTVYEADERDGMPYIAMEFLEGYSLDEYLKRKGNPTPAQALKLAAETATGLAAAHRQGLVHRDIKPGNLWMEAPNGRVKVLDFGLARPVDVDAELTKSGAVVGTPAYMSPEQARGEKLDHRTDLFSLGVVLYRLVTGRLPFQAPTTMAVLYALGSLEPPQVRSLNPNVPEALAELIHQLLAKTADARPASADEVLKRLRAIAKGQTAAAPAPIQVTGPWADDPSADLEFNQVEAEPAREPALGTTVRRKPPRRTWKLVAAGLAAVAMIAAADVVITIKNQDGTVTKIVVPQGIPVEIMDEFGKTIKVGGTGAKTPDGPGNPDRKAAEYVLSLGGVVRVSSRDNELRAVADLPKEPFTLTGLYLSRSAVTDAGLVNFKDCKGLAALALDQTKITDTGLANFKDCKGLTVLELRNTAVTDAGLVNFKDCKGLQELGLSGTKVTDAGLANFKDCKGLMHLHLESTGVTDAGLSHFKDCKGLQGLNLNATGIADAGLAHLKGCTGLINFHLRGTKVTAAGLADFSAAVPGCRIEHDGGVIEPLDVDRKAAEYVFSVGGVVKIEGQDRAFKAAADLPKERFTLKVVWLADNTKVTDAGLANFKDCKGLIFLDLAHSAVTDAGLAHFKNCKGLVRLNLKVTRVTDAGLANFKDCKQLESIDLRELAVTDAGLAHLKENKKLQDLRLSKNSVTDAGLANFKDCKGLTILDLYEMGVTDAGLAQFKDCSGLKVLNLKATKVTAAGLADFSAAVPGCRIEHDGGVIEPVDVDRKAAEYVISQGGLLRVKGQDREFRKANDLPKERFTLILVGLGGTQVTDEGLAQFKDCKELASLGLVDTKVTDAGLAKLKEYKWLTHLYLSGTKVTAAGLADFSAAVPGCRIEHDGGVIEPVDVDRKAAEYVFSLGGVVKIEGQDREFKAAADLPKERFTLTQFNIDSTKVTDAGLANFKDCKGLTSLGLSNTKVTDAGLALFKDCKKLRDISLWVTNVTDAGLAHFKDCKELEGLDLRSTGVTDAGLANFKDSKKLKVLLLDGPKVTDAGLAHFKDCKELLVIHLEGAIVTDTGLTQFKEYKELQRLNLSGTKVTDAGLVHLKGCKKLQVLYLIATKQTAAGLADFHAAVPGCAIEHDSGLIKPKK